MKILEEQELVLENVLSLRKKMTQINVSIREIIWKLEVKNCRIYSWQLDTQI